MPTIVSEDIVPDSDSWLACGMLGPGSKLDDSQAAGSAAPWPSGYEAEMDDSRELSLEESSFTVSNRNVEKVPRNDDTFVRFIDYIVGRTILLLVLRILFEWPET